MPRRHLIGCLLATALVVVLWVLPAGPRGGGDLVGRPLPVAGFTNVQTVGLATVETLPGVSARRAADLALWADGQTRAQAAWLGLPVPATLRVRLLPNRAAFVEYGRAFVAGFDDGMTFCYLDAEGLVLGYWTDETALRGQLRHEISHRIVHLGRPGTPCWLDEGLACLSEGLRDDGDGKLRLRMPDADRLFTASRLLRAGRAPGPADLAAARPAQFIGPNRLDWYSQSCAVTTWLYRQGDLAAALAGGAGAVDLVEFQAFLDQPERWRDPLPIGTPTDQAEARAQAQAAAIAHARQRLAAEVAARRARAGGTAPAAPLASATPAPTASPAPAPTASPASPAPDDADRTPLRPTPSEAAAMTPGTRLAGGRVLILSLRR